jgi:hypothetical protein
LHSARYGFDALFEIFEQPLANLEGSQKPLARVSQQLKMKEKKKTLPCPIEPHYK